MFGAFRALRGKVFGKVLISLAKKGVVALPK